MRYNMERFRGIFVALNAVYDEAGNINETALRRLANWYKDKGVNGLYVCGSTGEGIVMTLEERKRTLEILSDELGDSLTLIVHVGAPATKDAVELAKHAEAHGAHGTSAVSSIYYGLSEDGIAAHWNAIADAADLPFFIYNIPSCTNFALTPALFTKMLENDRVCGLKNTAMPCMDMTIFKALAPEDFIIFNGPDEQLAAGLAMGADGGIGGTYAVMPELYLKIWNLMAENKVKEAAEIQNECCRIIYAMCSCHGNLYAVMKEIIKKQYGLDMGGVRAPLANLIDADMEKVEACSEMIKAAIAKYC